MSESTNGMNTAEQFEPEKDSPPATEQRTVEYTSADTPKRESSKGSTPSTRSQASVAIDPPTKTTCAKPPNSPYVAPCGMTILPNVTKRHISLAERWDNNRYISHRLAIQNTRATVDNSCPASFGYWKMVNPKKIQTEKDRCASIGNYNKMILDKFQQISVATHREYVVNTQAEQLRDIMQKRVRNKRLKQLQTIDSENRTLLQRIEARSPTYQTKQWTKDRLQTLSYLVNASVHKSKYIYEMIELYTRLVSLGEPIPHHIQTLVGSFTTVQPTNVVKDQRVPELPVISKNPVNVL